ncbi:MAG: hypothetical protein NC311_08625 [Muribaculaceae bacterium]|nr:hypothetical protein [Muribaculaceae bacterium]MCM1399884.1 hypothetical protein [Clostridium sp.]MCM1460630.1 hypothetical protein [Bacteroides sp.]
MEFYRQIQPKARKEYICEYCGQKIHKGEVYSYETGKFEGEMFVRKLCLTCKNILDEFSRQHSWAQDGFNWTDVGYWLQEEYCNNCKHYMEDDCEHVIESCPLIRAVFEKEGDN